MRTDACAHSYPGRMDFRFVMPALESRSANSLAAVVHERTGADVDLRIGGSEVRLDDASRSAVLELLTQLSTGRAWPSEPWTSC